MKNRKIDQEKNLSPIENKKFGQYQIVGEGSKHIVDLNGRVVSRIYHNIEEFQCGPMMALIGRNGAIGRLLMIPSNPNEFFEESDAKFHSLHFDLGFLFAKMGAMHYVVEPLSGRIISKGHHSYFRKNGKLFGQIGATTEEVIFQSDQGEKDDIVGQLSLTLGVRKKVGKLLN